MRYRRCRNCRMPLDWGAICLDCSRMVVVTVISELVIAGLVLAGRAWWR